MLKKINLDKILNYLLLLFFFLLPWQARYIYAPVFLNGGAWEYGSGSFYVTEILLWIIIILSFINILKDKELLKKLKSKEHWQTHKVYLFISLLVFLFFGFLVVTSLDSEVSFNFVFHILEGACLVAVMASVARPHPNPPLCGGEGAFSSPLLHKGGGGGRSGTTQFLLALWLGGVVQGLLAIWQFFTLQVSTIKGLGMAPHLAGQLGDFVVEAGGERWLRAYGSFGSPNILGGYLAVIFILGLILLLNKNSKIFKYILTFGQLLVLSGLVLSFSRSAWLAAGAGVAVVVASFVIPNEAKRSEESPSRRGDPSSFLLGMTLAKQALLSVIIILFFFINLNPLFNARLNGEGRLEEKSINSRVSEYQEVLPIIKQHPWLGVGPGAYTVALYQLDPNRPAWQYQPIHNVYFLMLAEIGIIGCFFVFLFFCFLTRWLWKYNRLFLSILLVILTVALFDHWWWSMYFGQIFWWAVVGITVNGYQSELARRSP